MADNKYIVLPIRARAADSKLPVVHSKSDATPFNNVAVFGYGPGNVVYAPISGSYKLLDRSTASDDSDPDSDNDTIVISGKVNGKDCTVVVSAIDFESSSLPDEGTVKQGDPIGMTRHVTPNAQKYVNLGLQVFPYHFDGTPHHKELDKAPNPLTTAANDFGGLVWLDQFLDEKALGKKADRADTIANEGRQSSSGGGGMGDLIGYGVLGLVLYKIFGKGK